jgi:hypothetical protein
MSCFENITLTVWHFVFEQLTFLSGKRITLPSSCSPSHPRSRSAPPYLCENEQGLPLQATLVWNEMRVFKGRQKAMR